MKPNCKLVGADGNVFAIIGRVCRILKDAGQAERAQEFSERARAAKSYGEVLCLCFEYVNVT